MSNNSSPKSKPSTINILQWNCRSIDKNKDQLSQLLQLHQIDFICIQSPNCKLKNLPKLQGYFYPPTADTLDPKNKVFTGTCIYVRSSL